MKTVIHFNGYDLGASDWSRVNIGCGNLLGRIPTTLLCAAHTDPALIIWSSGATYLNPQGAVIRCKGVDTSTINLKGSRSEAELSLQTAIGWLGDGRLKPTAFEGVDLDSLREVITQRSVLEEGSVDTATSMANAVPLINEALGDGPGVIFTVTSANHAPRAGRDAFCAWKYGHLPNGRRCCPVRHPHLVHVSAVFADTCYGSGHPSDVVIDDLGRAHAV